MVQKIAILGAGTMGFGLAHLFVQNGVKVNLFDPDAEALKKAQAKLHQLANSVPSDKAGGGNIFPADVQIIFTQKLEEALPAADLIIEAAPERLEIKQQLFRNIEPLLQPEAIVVSNTSTFALSVLSNQLPYADRMLIAHFFNPPQVIPLVEIVQQANTKTGIAEMLAAFLTKCGKVPVLLKKDIDGFIANRLQAAILREACYLLESGVADVQQIDTVVKDGIGLRWALYGPFEIADYGGLDIWEKVTGNLFPVLSNAVSAPAVIQEKVKHNQLGYKTGQGFYSYSPHAEEANTREERLIKLIIGKASGNLES